MNFAKTRVFPILFLVVMVTAASGCRNRGRSPGAESCIPGTPLVVACADGCGVGSCTGDPVLRVCDGTSSVSACEEGVGQIAENDDARICSSGLCSAVQITCPPSGSITVTHRPFGSGSYRCDWDVQVAASPAPLTAAPADAGL